MASEGAARIAITESVSAPDCLCPTCGTHFNRAMGVTGAATPHPGDVSLCIRCASVVVFGDDLRVRTPTAAEMAEISTDATVRAAQDAIREVSRDLSQAVRRFRV